MGRVWALGACWGHDGALGAPGASGAGMFSPAIYRSSRSFHRGVVIDRIVLLIPIYRRVRPDLRTMPGVEHLTQFGQRRGFPPPPPPGLPRGGSPPLFLFSP